jgi:hypothetical protein
MKSIINLKKLTLILALIYGNVPFIAFSQNSIMKIPSEVTKSIWTANELWSQSVSQNLKFENNEIVLDDNVLIENDATGIGSIRSVAWDTIASGIILRKHLEIIGAPAKNALITMLLYPISRAGSVGNGKIDIKVNGHGPIVYEVGHAWTSVKVPTEYLKLGDNLVEVTSHGNDKFRIPLALYSNYKFGSSDNTPPSYRSERSVDNGKTWTSMKPGVLKQKSGEYPIRFKLQAYNKRGWLQTPVINVADKGAGGVLYFPSLIESLKIKVDNLNTAGSKWQVRIRSGNTHLPEIGGWTDWQNLKEDLLPTNPNHHFIQLEFSFEANTNYLSPKIHGLAVNSSWHAVNPQLSKQLIVSEVRNNPLIRTSFDFKHEDPSFVKLQEFRKQYQLDKIVEGSKTELEKIRRLRGWVAGSWEWYLPKRELDDMVAWDATEILNAESPNKIGGNCLFYAIVFAQACQSFGIPARIVNINYGVGGGHEITEVWSRELEKWIMVDPNFDTTYYYRENGIPLSVLELHKVFLDTYYHGKEVVNRDTWTDEDRDRRSGQLNPESLPIAMEVGGHANSGRINKDYVWWKKTVNKQNSGYNGGYGFFNTAEVRWLPRSNWLSQPTPMPITHGRTHWGWDGYLGWTDPQTPETPEHRYFVRRESDIYPRLFMVDFSAEPADSGTLKINMATNSPGFKHFELIANGKQVIAAGNSYLWKLASGLNTLELRSVDVLGNRGGTSSLKINYIP